MEQVYNVTKFLDDHPGGDDVLLSSTGTYLICIPSLTYTITHLNYMFSNVYLTTQNVIFAGRDATDDFEDVGHSKSARAMLDDLYVGDIDPATMPAKAQQAPPKPLQDNQKNTSSSGFMIKMLQFLVPLIVLGFAVGIRFYSNKST